MRHQIQNTFKRMENTRVIQKENYALFRRLNKAQSFISPKDLDKDFKQNHDKLKSQMSKIRSPSVPNPLTKIKQSFSQASIQKKNEHISKNIKKIQIYNFRKFNHFTINNSNSLNNSNTPSIVNTHINNTNFNNKEIVPKNEESFFFTQIRKQEI